MKEKLRHRNYTEFKIQAVKLALNPDLKTKDDGNLLLHKYFNLITSFKKNSLLSTDFQLVSIM